MSTVSPSQDHLPLGAGSVAGSDPVPLCRLDRFVVRFDILHDLGLLDGSGLDGDACHGPNLDLILAAGPETWARLRQRLNEFVAESTTSDRIADALVPIDSVRMVLPFTVSDFVDFYSSVHHATNVGRIFRPDGDPLLPNWRHIPVGYHGRSASIAVSGSPVRRPCGIRPIDGSPEFGPTEALDFELEVGFVVGIGNTSTPISTDDFSDHVFGLCLVNDWSARDIQSFEYQPLGPFLAKSFHTSISPWITPLGAVEAFRVEPPPPEIALAPYLQRTQPWGLDLDLEVLIESRLMREAGIEPMSISQMSFADMTWTPDQQLAHLTVNGSTVRTGDFYASGTVSGPVAGTEGSLLERTHGGRVPMELPDGSTRSYLLEGDRVTLRGRAGSEIDESRFELGEVSGEIVAPHPHGGN